MMTIMWKEDVDDIKETEDTKNPKPKQEDIKEVLADIQSSAVDEPAFDYSSSQEMYEYLRENLTDCYVSETHVYDKDLKMTFYVIARDKKAYDKFDEEFEGQHYPDETLKIDKWGKYMHENNECEQDDLITESP